MLVSLVARGLTLLVGLLLHVSDKNKGRGGTAFYTQTQHPLSELESVEQVGEHRFQMSSASREFQIIGVQFSLRRGFCDRNELSTPRRQAQTILLVSLFNYKDPEVTDEPQMKRRTQLHSPPLLAVCPM